MSSPAVDNSKIRELIVLLEMVRHRPGMYLGSDDPERFAIFMTGLQVACRIFGIDLHMATGDIYEAVIVEHGWDVEFSGASLRSQMQTKGIDNQSILNTLIDVEIEVLKRRYNIEISVM